VSSLAAAGLRLRAEGRGGMFNVMAFSVEDVKVLAKPSPWPAGESQPAEGRRKERCSYSMEYGAGTAKCQPQCGPARSAT
jgi:hypothetical protein